MVDASYFDKDYFESGHKTTATDMLKGRRGDPVAMAIADLLCRCFGLGVQSSVLEFGCGKGEVVRALTHRGISAWGFDISKYAVEAGDIIDTHQVSKRCILWQHDATKSWKPSTPVSLRYPLSLVYSIEVMEHIPKKEVLKVFDEAYEALAVGGYLVCSIATHRDLARVEKILRYHPEQRDESHVTLRPYSWWVSKGEQVGLEFDYGAVQLLARTSVPMTCSPYHSCIDRSPDTSLWSPLDDSPFELSGRFAWTLFVWRKPE